MISTRTFAVLLTTYLCAVCALLAASASADASSGKRCTAMGRSVPASVADVPDFKVDLRAGESITLPLGLATSITEMHAYGYRGEATRQYACSARGGVDQWDEWRRNGRTLARFDGITFYALHSTLIYAWHG